MDSLGLARECYERAIALDPEYADPHTGLASYYMMMNNLGVISPQEAALPGRAACERALEIDPSNALAHANLAAVARVYDLDWLNAERHLEIALTAEAVPAFVHYLACLHHYCLFYENISYKVCPKPRKTTIKYKPFLRSFFCIM